MANQGKLARGLWMKRQGFSWTPRRPRNRVAGLPSASSWMRLASVSGLKTDKIQEIPPLSKGEKKHVDWTFNS